MGKHMPEPWSIKLDRPAGTPASANERPLDALIMSSGRYICRCRDFMGEDPTNIADAKRIVACVNACEGITTEALEAGVVEDSIGIAITFYTEELGPWVSYEILPTEEQLFEGIRVWEEE